jgi:hypothetical protein
MYSCTKTGPKAGGHLVCIHRGSTNLIPSNKSLYHTLLRPEAHLSLHQFGIEIPYTLLLGVIYPLFLAVKLFVT